VISMQPPQTDYTAKARRRIAIEEISSGANAHSLDGNPGLSSMRTADAGKQLFYLNGASASISFLGANTCFIWFYEIQLPVLTSARFCGDLLIAFFT